MPGRGTWDCEAVLLTPLSSTPLATNETYLTYRKRIRLTLVAL